MAGFFDLPEKKIEMVLFDSMKKEIRPLSTCLQRAAEEGYHEKFKISDELLFTEDGKYSYEASEINIDSTCRFESADPMDESTVYMMETSDGRLGVVVDDRGPFAQTTLAAFIRKVNDSMESEKLREGRSWKEFLKGY